MPIPSRGHNNLVRLSQNFIGWKFSIGINQVLVVEKVNRAQAVHHRVIVWDSGNLFNLLKLN